MEAAGETSDVVELGHNNVEVSMSSLTVDEDGSEEATTAVTISPQGSGISMYSVQCLLIVHGLVRNGHAFRAIPTHGAENIAYRGAEHRTSTHVSINTLLCIHGTISSFWHDAGYQTNNVQEGSLRGVAVL